MPDNQISSNRVFGWLIFPSAQTPHSKFHNSISNHYHEKRIYISLTSSRTFAREHCFSFCFYFHLHLRRPAKTFVGAFICNKKQIPHSIPPVWSRAPRLHCIIAEPWSRCVPDLYANLACLAQQIPQ